MKNVYEKLRAHLDELPGGYPTTESGVEIRILKKIFTPEEAELALHLGLKQEPASVIAGRAGMDQGKTTQMLEKMARKGLIFSIETHDRPPAYMASQFMMGIWEYHVNELDEDFVTDMDAYMPTLSGEAFDHLPQLRTIPLGKSIDARLEILPHEKAEELIRKQKKFLVAPCICRKDHQLKGQGCDKPLEVCLFFGWAADFYERNKLGRVITLEETLDIIRKADEEGLVLQPSNTQEITNICLCCGDCCHVLLNLKRHPFPAAMASSSFMAKLDPETCIGCQVCLDRCQMGALRLEGDQTVLNADCCIGCGLCVSTCASGALTLERKPQETQSKIPKNQIEAFSMRLQARIQTKSGLDNKLERLQKI